MLPERPDRPCPGRRHGRSARPAGGRSSPVETACGRARPVLRSSLPSPRSSLLRPRAGTLTAGISTSSIAGIRAPPGGRACRDKSGGRARRDPGAVQPVETLGRSSLPRPVRRSSLSRPQAPKHVETPGGANPSLPGFRQAQSPAAAHPRGGLRQAQSPAAAHPAADFDKLNRRRCRFPGGRACRDPGALKPAQTSPAVEPVETPGENQPDGVQRRPRAARRSSAAGSDVAYGSASRTVRSVRPPP